MKLSARTLCSFVILSVSVLIACKKSKNSASSGSMLEGKWKTVSYGYDVNKNSIIDPDENITSPDSISDYVIFNQSGNGMFVSTQGGTTDTVTWFTWSLADNTDITITRTKGNPSFISLSGINTYHIDVLSATDLRLTITASTSGLNWQNYKKQ